MAGLDSRVCMVGLVCPEETKYGALDSPGGEGDGGPQFWGTVDSVTRAC